MLLELLEYQENTSLYEKTTKEIEDRLALSKAEGHKKGGIKSQELYSYQKDKSGKITGNRRR